MLLSVLIIFAAPLIPVKTEACTKSPMLKIFLFKGFGSAFGAGFSAAGETSSTTV